MDQFSDSFIITQPVAANKRAGCSRHLLRFTQKCAHFWERLTLRGDAARHPRSPGDISKHEGMISNRLLYPNGFPHAVGPLRVRKPLRRRPTRLPERSEKVCCSSKQLQGISKKAFAVILIFLLIHGPTAWGSPKGGSIKHPEDLFAAALRDYRNGLVEPAAAALEKIKASGEEGDPVLRAKVYLLLGACFEKLKKGDKARESFLELKKMLDKGTVDPAPRIPGVEPESFPAYREIFTDRHFFAYKEPVPVADVMKNNVIHAPHKSVEEKEKEKKKRKFPWLIAVGAVVIIGTVAVLLFTGQKGDNKPDFQEVEWVHIPAGEFSMGDNFDEGDADEQPVHTVYLDEYHISKYEITYTQYDSFCEETGRKKPPDVFVWGSYDRRGRFPVVSVSWDDAAAFCEWLSLRTGKNIRLPTEAQWEKAARGIQQYRYPWGNSDPTCSKANYYGCGMYSDYMSELAHIGLHGTGTSPYGAHDMAGNAWEWCRDWYDPSYYSVSPGNNPQGPGKGTFRVIRGGGIDSPGPTIRAANRYFHNPSYGRPELGFRVVMESN